MKILIDTNILIDYLVERELYYENARCILLACRDGRVHAGIASHSISNIFYILRREIPEEDRRIALKALCTITEVIGID